jgi:2-haloacid dehalogenase
MTTRRQFIFNAAVFAATSSVAAETDLQQPGKIKAVLFDAFVIFDPRPIAALAEQNFPGRGAELLKVWRTRQFEYTLLRTCGDHFTDFWEVTEDALTFAARSLSLDLAAAKKNSLMNAHLSLPTWPDVPEALKTLKGAGIRLALLSNFTQLMLRACVNRNNLQNFFDHLLSVDSLKKFKPAPKTYHMSERAFKMRASSMAFAAFAGWDAAGARWFGHPTVWVNRLSSPAEELSAECDLACPDMSGLLKLVGVD